MTRWIFNKDGNLFFTEGPWTVTVLSYGVDVHHTDKDFDVSVDRDGFEVFGACGSGWDRSPVRVYIPLTVVRAMLEGWEKVVAGMSNA